MTVDLLNKKIKVAICYDFDKTLTPRNMQEQGFIEEIGLDEQEFWKRCNALAKENHMDQNCTYMYQMMIQSRGKNVFTKKTLKDFGKKIGFFNGVESWFRRINSYADKLNIEIEHFIISSGLKEMIEGSNIAGNFKEIYANSFFYDDNDVATWPATIVNYTNKTQFLFRIEKGIFDINDERVNDKFSDDQLYIPFKNMIYIGDSATDIPCMQLVKKYGGYSICVYSENKTNALKMIKDDRVSSYVEADYSTNSELSKIIRKVLENINARSCLDMLHNNCCKEVNDSGLYLNKGDQARLIVDLYNSCSFERTHEIVDKLKLVKDWSNQDKNTLVDIALTNSQVYYIMSDPELKEFYETIINGMDQNSNNIKKIKDLMVHDYKYNIKHEKKYLKK